MERTPVELADQLALIERMLREGQRTIGRHGWIFVTWGVGHIAALLWSQAVPAHGGLPWAVLMGACGILTGVGSALQGRRAGKTTAVGRALGAVWSVFGISLGLLWGVGMARHMFTDSTSFLFVFFVLVGAANFTSGVILRWPLQLAVGVLWWSTGVLTMFRPGVTLWCFLAVALVGEVLFGAYLMVTEQRETRSAA